MAAGRNGSRAFDQVTPFALEEAWQETAARAGLAGPEAGEVFQDLSRRYSEPGRAYHDLDHIAAMLKTVSEFEGTMQDDVAVRLAVWFHDAVYDSHANDNEERSAELARHTLSRASLDSRLLDKLSEHIIATKHHANTKDNDTALFLDIDLAILSALLRSTCVSSIDQLKLALLWNRVDIVRRSRRSSA